MKRFTQFVEAKSSAAVFTFGRFNPPTIGHQKLLQAVHKVARQKGGDAHIFGSFTQDKKKNPLSHVQKMKYLKEMFPKEMRGHKPTSGLNTAIDVAVHLDSYQHLIMVVGSDRVNDFQHLLDKYNGVDARHGKYHYESIEVISAGDRDPDAEGVTGMSASKMRAAAGSGDYESFQMGCPEGYDCSKLYNDVRRGLKITEGIKPFKPVVEMTKMEFVREQYFQNLIFNIGEWVKDRKSKIIGEVVKRGTNYVTVVQEDFALQKIWLEDVVAIEKQRTELPEAINFIKNRNLWEKYQRETRKREEGSPELTNACKKLTPGQTVKETPEMVSQLSTKFKIPTNVSEAIVKNTVNAGIDPLEIKSYSTLLSTYMNLMDEKITKVDEIFVVPLAKAVIGKLYSKDDDEPKEPVVQKIKNKAIEKRSKLHKDFPSKVSIGQTMAKRFNPGNNPLISKLMNSEDKIPEVAPPGKEKVVKALKKKWPDNLKRVYATAWWQYNKEKGKND